MDADYKKIGSSDSNKIVSVVNLILTVILSVLIVGILAVSIYVASKSKSNNDDNNKSFGSIGSSVENLNDSISQLADSVSNLNDSVENLNNSISQLTDSVTNLNSSVESLNDSISQLTDAVAAFDSKFTLPSKYAVEKSVPRLLQLNRGTCWAFGTIGALEHSYRLNGLKNGYLEADEYVPFSLQAYGISVVNECKDQGDICEVLGDEVYVYNNADAANTDGGEVSYIYYLKNLWNQIFPEPICEYLPESDQWKECDNLPDAIAADNNPIRFNITDMQTAYDVEDTKMLLYKQKETLAISTPVHDNYFYIPCYNTPDVSPLCKEYSEEQKVGCPPWIHIAYPNADQTPVLCVKQWQPGYNMDGEWYIAPHVQYAAEGGHAMQIVGFNDHYRSYQDDVGGFLIKNSWIDQSYLYNLSQGLARGGRGSHSIGYLQMKISDWDERQICPNADNPLNWLSCTEVAGGPTSAGDHRMPSRDGNTRRLTSSPKIRNRMRKKFRDYIQKHNDASTDVGAHAAVRANQANPAAPCLDDDFRTHFVNLTKQPMQFKCRIEDGSNGADRFGCKLNYHYYLDWMEFDENGYVDANFIEVNPEDGTFLDFTVHTLPLAVLAEVFLPDEDAEFYKNNLLNSVDECGYYFFPYSLLEKSSRKASSWFSTHFNVEWSPSSYLSQQSSYPDYDYSYLENGVKTQTIHSYGGPEPYTVDATNPPHPEPDWPFHAPRSSAGRKVAKGSDL